MDLEGPDTDVAIEAEAGPVAEQQPGVSSVTRPRSRRGGPGTAPQGSGPAYRLVPPQHTPGTAPQVCTLWRSAHGQVQSALSTWWPVSIWSCLSKSPYHLRHAGGVAVVQL